VIKNEKIRLDATVSDSGPKKPPVTPPRKASGTKTTTVAALEPAKGLLNSAAAANTPPFVPLVCRTRRTICSIMTIASSMIRPAAAAMPPRVMMLKLMWSA
jgi:hypothetical protein